MELVNVGSLARNSLKSKGALKFRNKRNETDSNDVCGRPPSGPARPPLNVPDISLMSEGALMIIAYVVAA